MRPQTQLRLTVATLLVGIAPAAVADIIEVPSLVFPHSWIDMDRVGTRGAVTVADINAAGTSGGGNIEDMYFTPALNGPVPDAYDTMGARGRGLAANPDGSMGLYLVDHDPAGGPPAQFIAADELVIELGMLSGEFGWSVGDWAGSFNAHLFHGVAPVGTIQVSGAPGPHFIRSLAGFDRVVLTARWADPNATWVVPDIYVQIPAPPALGLLVLGLGRRRRTQRR